MAAHSRETTNRICKQTAPQVIQSSKIEYCNAPLQSCRSMAWQFFTADKCCSGRFSPRGRALGDDPKLRPYGVAAGVLTGAVVWITVVPDVTPAAVDFRM